MNGTNWALFDANPETYAEFQGGNDFFMEAGFHINAIDLEVPIGRENSILTSI